MTISIIYIKHEFFDKEDTRHEWKYKTSEISTSKAVGAALNEFYQWASDNKMGAIVQMIFLDDSL
jgi:hypothetical protein